MPNIYVIKCVIGSEGAGGTDTGYLSIGDDGRLVMTKEEARHFDNLLSADSYAAGLDLTYPLWRHIVEVL